MWKPALRRAERVIASATYLTEDEPVDSETDFCGCCGRDAVTGFLWCAPCAEHVGGPGPAWTQTYFSQYGRDCPYQEESP